jgi:hypothetical protein
MTTKTLLSAITLLIFSFYGYTQAPNPFQSIGKKQKVLTLSNGRYDESFQNDSLEQICSVVINRYSRKIQKFLDEKTTSEITARSTGQSRFLSVDPLAAKFPYYSPYNFAGNTPIRASDLDGLEPNFKYKGNDINGVGLFDPNLLSSITRHSTVLTVGTKDKQFQIQWLLNNNGEAIGYLASRVVPQAEYESIYGGTGKGLQEAYVIGLDKFGDFTKNSDKYYDASRNAELEDALYGEIDRDPVKSLFDPRAWLVGNVLGVTGGLAGEFMVGRLMSSSINESGILAVTQHLSQFDAPENDIMIDRLKKISTGEMKATDIDMNFYKHELREAELMKKGMSYDDAHKQTLQEQGMYEKGYENKLYTKEALDAGNAKMEKDATNKQ